MMSNYSKGVIAAVFSMIFLSTYSVFGKILLQSLTPETLAAVSQGLSVLTIFIFFGFFPEIRDIIRLPQLDKIWLLVVSILSAVIAPLLLLQGLLSTSATNSVIIGRLEPVFAGLISFIWLKEKATIHQIIGALVMFVGVMYIITKGFGVSFDYNQGDLFIIGSALSWAFATNIFKKKLHHIVPELVVLFRNIIGTIILFFLIPFMFNVQHDMAPLLESKTAFTIIFFSLFTIILAQFLWYSALELIPASLASSIGLLSPFFGVLFAIVILREDILPYHYIGGILVMIGLVFTVYHHQQHPKHQLIEKVKHWTH